MANNIVPFPRPGSNDNSEPTPPSGPAAFIAALTSTNALTSSDYAEARSQPEPRKLEMFDSLRHLPDSYFVQLVKDDRNAPLLHSGEVVIADQGSPQRGGWLPIEGGLFVIEYNGGLNDYPNQRYPRVSQSIVQTFRDDKGRWFVGGIQRGLVRNTFYTDDGPYDPDQLAAKLVGRVVGILVSSMVRKAA